MFAKGRVALVTGAGGVIGREVALGFLREGVNVAAVDMSAERLEETVADAKELSGSIMTFKINVANKNECMKLVESIVAEYGRVDILANVAGVMINETIRNVTEEHWDLTQEVNVKGPLYLTQAVFEHMKAQKYGRIINVCSPAYKGGFGQMSYSASKGALMSMTMVTAQEMAKYGVTANAVLPGLVSSNITANMKPEMFESIAARQPMGRICKASDVAYAIRCFAADEAEYISGQMLMVTGAGTTVL